MKNLFLTVKNLIFLFKTQMKESPKSVFYELVYGFFTSFRPFAAILFPKFILDAILYQKAPSVVLLTIAIFSLLEFIFSYICSFIVEVQSVHNEKVPHVLLLLLAQKAAKIDYSDMEQNELIVKYQQAQNTTFGLAGITMGMFNCFISSFFKIVMLVYIMSSLNWGIVLVLLSIVVINLVIDHFADKKKFDYQMQENKGNIELSFISLCCSAPQLAKDLRIYDGTEFFEKKYNRATHRQEQIISKRNSFGFGIECMQQLVSMVQSGLVYAFVVFSYMLGKISISSFSMYVGATVEFYGTISSLLNVVNSLNQTNMFMEQYAKFLDYPENMNRTGGLDVNTKERLEIEWRDVSFRYPGQEAYALHHVNIKFDIQDTIGIVGENGAGKSTFVMLLLRLYDVTSGEILLNGINIKEYNYRQYLSLFSAMFQDYNLFSYSIKENIGFDEADDRLEDVERVIDEVVLRDKVRSLSLGLDTYINRNFHNGTALSGGEMQRIALARAFFKKGDVMILDEPNAAIDPLTEQAIFKSIEEKAASKLIMHISHRLSSTKNCSKIFVFDKGNIVEVGSHNELMDKEGIYRKMFDTQAEYYRQVEAI